MNPKQVRSLLAVVKHGGINKAAVHLCLAPSSVSAQIKELEQELGSPLFESKGRNIVLNTLGHSLLASFQHFCAQEKQIKMLAQDASTRLNGSISIYAPSSMCIYRLPTILKRLQQSAPKLEALLVHEPYDYRTAILQGELDAAIIVREKREAPKTITGEYHYQKIENEDLIYVTHPSLHQNKTLTLEELIHQALITTELECSYRQYAQAHFERHGLRLNPRQSFSNVEVIKQCLLGRMGVGLLPKCSVAIELANEDLLEQRVQGAPYQFESLLVYPKRGQQSSKVEALVDAVKHNNQDLQ